MQYPLAISATQRRVSRWLMLLILGLLWLTPAPILAGHSSASSSDAGSAQATHPTVYLPKEISEIDDAIARIETRLQEVRFKVSGSQFATNSPPTRAPGLSSGTLDELAEKEQNTQRWLIALDQHARHLRHLKEVRRRNVEQAAERESWRGFPQPPTVLLAEQLTDAVSAQRLELRAAQMFLSILEGEIVRCATRLAESQRQLRLARDPSTTLQASRSLWLLQSAELRSESDQASAQAAEIGRLVTWEALEGLRRHLEFLEVKVATARAQAHIAQADLDGMLRQISEKRRLLQKDLNEAIATDNELRVARDTLAAKGQSQSLDAASALDLALTLEVQNACVETSRRKVEAWRGFLQLTDHAQAVWEDRLWATRTHPLAELRAKQRHYRQLLDGLQQWKTLMEQSLAAVSEQVLRHQLRHEDTRLSTAERDAAVRVRATLQERASIEMRVVGALVFTEDLTSRLHAELVEQTALVSWTGWLQAGGHGLATVGRQLWNAELYIAEDSVIASGQKISVPRSITLGKVMIALTIFAAGLWAAAVTERSARRFGARWFKKHPTSADVHAKALAVSVALLSLLVAMASVRIPWTVFAFLGGALAIGVGFGAQTLINNFISGVILLCERSIRVGDIVEVDEQRGKVVRVGFRNSLVSRGDGIEVLIPNSQFLEKKVVNWTLSDDLVRYSIKVGVAYGSSPDKVTRLIAQAASEHPYVLTTPAPEVSLDDFGDNALVFGLQFWMRLSPTVGSGKVRSELRHRIHELFEEADVTMAFPQRDIHLDASRPLEIKLVNAPVESAVF